MAGVLQLYDVVTWPLQKPGVTIDYTDNPSVPKVNAYKCEDINTSTVGVLVSLHFHSSTDSGGRTIKTCNLASETCERSVRLIRL